MALFDSIINEAQQNFEMGGKANDLLKTLLAMLSDRENGGFNGFMARFDEAGLGDLATSWVNAGANMPISFEQTESVFGEGTLKDVAAEVGLDYKTATNATAFMTPHIVDELTPTGEVPEDADLNAILGGFIPGNAVDDPETFASVSRVEAKGSFIKLILPLLLFIILIAVGYKVCSKPNTQVRQTTAPEIKDPGVSKIKAKPAQVKNPSSFTLKADGGKYSVSGIVVSEAIKNQIIETLTANFGEGKIDFSGLRVDGSAEDFGPGWWTNLTLLLPNMTGWQTGELSFSGSTVTAASGLPGTTIDQIRNMFGSGWKLPVSIIGAETAAKEANENALTELAGAESVEQVVDALNISIINFASGSAVIPADAEQVLQKAAEVLKTQPAGTMIEIGGYTDSDGADAANLKLSEARANAVRNELVKLGVADAVLTAKGFGEANPVAPNDTSDNKFKNRRIAYKVVGGLQ